MDIKVGNLCDLLAQHWAKKTKRAPYLMSKTGFWLDGILQYSRISTTSYTTISELTSLSADIPQNVSTENQARIVLVGTVEYEITLGKFWFLYFLWLLINSN